MDMQQSSFGFLHLSRPYAAVHMSPFVLSNIQQPTSILHIQHTDNATQLSSIYMYISEHKTVQGITYIGFGISMLLAEWALSLIQRLGVYFLLICDFVLIKIWIKQDKQEESISHKCKNGVFTYGLRVSWILIFEPLCITVFIAGWNYGLGQHTARTQESKGELNLKTSQITKTTKRTWHILTSNGLYFKELWIL